VSSKWLALVALLVTLSAAGQPVVVELFTSQGCSSCPPADALVGELARRPGVIALAYHVDYWDELGWKDRFSIPEAGQRQRGYVKRLARSGLFTPQIVVSGDTSLVGSNRAAVESAVAEDRDALAVVLSRAGGALHIQFPEAWREPMEVHLITYMREAASKVDAGENARRTLRHFNVVRSFKTLGTWSGKPQRMTVLIAGLPQESDAVAVILQRKNQGAVSGAATLALASSE
jgi:hypothetical protein